MIFYDIIREARIKEDDKHAEFSRCKFFLFVTGKEK